MPPKLKERSKFVDINNGGLLDSAEWTVISKMKENCSNAIKESTQGRCFRELNDWMQLDITLCGRDYCMQVAPDLFRNKANAPHMHSAKRDGQNGPNLGDVVDVDGNIIKYSEQSVRHDPADDRYAIQGSNCLYLCCQVFFSLLM